MTQEQGEDSNIIDAQVVVNDDVRAREMAVAKLTAAIHQLETVVLSETNGLENHEALDFSDINTRKTRGLRDLSQTLAGIGKYMDRELENEVERLLAGLKQKLERNSEVLKMHLDAVSELAQIMQATAQASETDGTYDPYTIATEK